MLGESVASCSYHLSILAKYGYVELVPDQPGREKPWRLTTYEQNLDYGGPDVEGSLAAEAAIEVFLDHEVARTKDRLRRKDLEPEEWRPDLRGETTFLTIDELGEVRRELGEILARYSKRAENPALRPAGGREVRLFVATSAAPPLPPKPKPSVPPKRDRSPAGIRLTS